jgi:hypothetical protein
MKAARIILLLLVVVLGFVSEAGASYGEGPSHDCTIKIAGKSFGFVDWQGIPGCTMYLGPLGRLHAPFSAKVGLVAFCCILATLIIVPVMLTMRWKKNRATG